MWAVALRQSISLPFTNILTVFRTANPTVPRSWVRAQHLIWMCWHSVTFPDPLLCFPHSPTLSFPYPFSLSHSITPSHQPHQSSPQSHTLLWGKLIAYEIVVHVKYRLKADLKKQKQGGFVKCHAWSVDGSCYLHACTHTVVHAGCVHSHAKIHGWVSVIGGLN